MELSIVIVNYNVKFFLEQCLCSVIKAIENIEAEIFVIDNNSLDGSKEFFKGKFNEVKFIWNEKNYGFAKANNIALSLARGKYILFLNPDTIVPEDCFTKCISLLETHENAGALGIHMIDGSGKFLKESKRSFPSPLTSLYKLSGLAKLFPHSKIFARYYLGNLDETKTNVVDVLAGAFIMIPKKIFNELGGFDESFFMYGEDIDLSYRVQKAGYKNFYFAGSTIIHFKGESTKKGSLNYVRVFYKAMSIFVKKHYGGSKAGWYNFLIQCAIVFRACISATGRVIHGLLNSLKFLNKENENDKQTLVVGSYDEYVTVNNLMLLSGLHNRVLERIKVSDKDETKSIGNIEQLIPLLNVSSVKEVILCEGELSFKKIIELAKIIPRHIRIKFYASCSKSIIGSDSKNIPVKIVTQI